MPTAAAQLGRGRSVGRFESEAARPSDRRIVDGSDFWGPERASGRAGGRAVSHSLAACMQAGFSPIRRQVHGMI